MKIQQNQALSLALDIGSTAIKAGILNSDYQIESIQSVQFPKLTSDNFIRECSPILFKELCTDLLQTLARPSISLGITSQRSSFLLWEKEGGKPLTPLISWQDRRASKWCQRNLDLEKSLYLESGLPLSPHYAGAKLASLFEQDPQLKKGFLSGKVLFGTLETYLIWTWTEGKSYQTDLSIAARTLLASPKTGKWSTPLTRKLALPSSLFPTIASTFPQHVQTKLGPIVRSTISDQGASVLCSIPNNPDEALINFGTGTFVLTPQREQFKVMDHYLTGPIHSSEGKINYALEGTINSGGAIADQFESGGTPTENLDHFCFPDNAGIGAPHWIAHHSLSFSSSCSNLSSKEKRIIFLEGVVFRCQEILDQLFVDKKLNKVTLSGGLSQDPFVSQAIADCTEVKVVLSNQPHTTLLGAARMAAGIDPYLKNRDQVILPGKYPYLKQKYLQWKKWSKKHLDTL